MSSNRKALIVMGALMHAQAAAPLAGLVETARAEGTQVVFVGDDAGVTPTFPDWVIEARGAGVFDQTNLAAQLRASGITQLSIAGPDATVSAARDLGFVAESALSLA